jgi:hypothetical protein
VGVAPLKLMVSLARRISWIIEIIHQVTDAKTIAVQRNINLGDIWQPWLLNFDVHLSSEMST